MTDPGRSCPPSETLAAYLDGTLTKDERAQVETHLADCSDCRELLVETVRFQQADTAVTPKVVPFRRRVVMAASGLAVAAALVLAVRFGAPLWWEQYVRGNPRPELVELVAAVGPSRPVEARLTGGFAFGAIASATRSGAPADVTIPPAVRIAAARLEQRAAEGNAPAYVAALGVASLAMGDVERAVTLLEEAVMNAPSNGLIQNDLAAAYLARSEDGAHAEDLPRALAAADRAIQAGAPIEALFNRALALERLRLRMEADRAWEAYLERDSTSPWAGEARRYLEAGRAGGSPATQATEALAALTPADAAGIARAVTAFPQETRERVENTLLPVWADAVLQSGGNAEATLALAEGLAQQLAKTTGDTLALEATASARRASRSPERARALARGHQAYRDGLRHYSRFDLEPARAAFETAKSAFVAEASPFRHWSDLHLAILADYRREYEGALRQLDDLLRVSPSSYRTLRARALWIRGLVRSEVAQFAGALEDDLAARAIYVEIGESANAAWMETLIAELFRVLGETDLAWHYRTAALARHQPRSVSRNRQSILLGASRSARDEGLLPASVYFDAEAAVIARQDAPAACAQVEVRRISALRELDRASDVRAAIESARACLGKVEDPSLSARLGAELIAEEGLTAARTDAGTAVDQLTKAIEYAESVAELSTLPRLYLERGRVYRRLGQPDAAANDFNSGIEQFERYRSQPGPAALRISYFDESWRLFDELISLQAVGQANPDAALVTAERRRRDESQSGTGETAQGSPAPDGVVLYFAALPDRLLTWVLTSGSSQFTDRPISSARLDVLVSDLQRARELRAGDRVRAASTTVYDEIIRPVAQHLPDDARVTIVPDGALHRVPFAQLYDRTRQVYFIERHALTIAPSLARREGSTREGAEHRRALVITPPAQLVAGLRPLTQAVEEGRTIARGYGGATTTLDGTAASVDSVVAALPQHDIVHFAGHAIANPDYPSLSRLILAPSSFGSPASMLTSEQVSRLDLSRTSLIVLAACSTAAGRISRGQGALGLSRPFLDAGARSVVATLWDVDDRASRALFTAFHDHFRASGDVAMALREAQMDLIASTDVALRDPASWAGVVHQARLGSR